LFETGEELDLLEIRVV